MQRASYFGNHFRASGRQSDAGARERDKHADALAAFCPVMPEEKTWFGYVATVSRFYALGGVSGGERY